MATEKWIAGSGAGLTWTEAIAAADLQNLTAAYTTCTTADAVTNGTALDIFADFSFALKVGGTTAAPNYVGVYLYPLNEDGSTYGDNTAGSKVNVTPSATYWVGNIIVPTGITNTNFIYGQLNRVILPPGTFLWVIQIQIGVALYNDTNSICKYRTYNRSIA